MTDIVCLQAKLPLSYVGKVQMLLLYMAVKSYNDVFSHKIERDGECMINLINNYQESNGCLNMYQESINIKSYFLVCYVACYIKCSVHKLLQLLYLESRKT